MPAEPVVDENPSVSRPRVLLGKIVTMEGAVIDQGAVYCRNGEIHRVQAAGETPPSGFEHAARIETGGVIYPGLIDLHNHLEYNVQTLGARPDHMGIATSGASMNDIGRR